MPEPEATLAASALVRSPSSRGRWPPPPPADVRPERLRALAEELGASAPTAALPLGAITPTWPPRSPEAVYADIAAGKRVAAIESWRLIEDLEWWAALGRSAPDAARTFWRAANGDAGLRGDLRWSVGKVLGGLDCRCPAVLADAFHDGPEADAPFYEILKDGDAERLVRLAARRTLSPRELIVGAGFFGALPIVRSASSLAVGVFLDGGPQLEAWLVRCLGDLDPMDRDLAVRELLDVLTDDDASGLQELRQALQRWYAVESEAAARLPAPIRERLDRWRGFAGWDDLLRFTEEIVGIPASRLPYLQSRHNNLNTAEQRARSALGRVEFWSNYASRFLQVGFFVSDKQRREHFARPDGGYPGNVHVGQGGPHVILVADHIAVLCYLYTPDQPTSFFRLPPGADPSELARSPEALRRNTRKLRDARVWGHQWQPELYATATELGLYPTEGLREFRGVRRAHLDPETGMPRVRG